VYKGQDAETNAMLGFFGSKPKRPEPKVSPRAAGQWLANKLDERCTISNITEDQQGLADQIGSPLVKLFDEIVILSAFSIDFAILAMLHGNPHQGEVREGFIGGVQGWPAESVNKSMRVQFGLREKGQRYHTAAMESMARPPERLGDPLADAFCDFIYVRKPLEEVQRSQDLAAELGRAHMLAMLTVQADFWYYQELCQHIFTECGLTPVSRR
jgi:hypothetical protein